MKQRIIVAVIGIPLLLAILCVAPDWATAALLAALSVVGTHELLAAVCGPEKTRRWTALPAVMGILVVLHFYGAGHGWQLPLGIVDGLLLVGGIALPEADTVVTAVMGSVGLEPTLAAIREKKRIALANKETLVCAGELVMAEAERCGAEIVPVDSEHSAIFQSLQGCRDRREVKRLLLTCSGGPFFGLSHEELEHKTPADALKHPNWSMGAKITIDSATLMNKGLEIIEAMRLYRLPVEQVEAVIHRQSIVHSLVEYRDGAMIAQLGTADMKLPIRYAFTWPYRAETPDRTLDLLSCGPLTFQAPDTEAFPCLAIARRCARTGGTACAIMNGANEEAVGLFLRQEIGFNDIARRVEDALCRVEVKYTPSLEDILEADRLARAAVLNR